MDFLAFVYFYKRNSCIKTYNIQLFSFLYLTVSYLNNNQPVDLLVFGLLVNELFVFDHLVPVQCKSYVTTKRFLKRSFNASQSSLCWNKPLRRLCLSSNVESISLTQFFYKAFHRFGQAKITYGGLVLGLSQFSLLPQLPKKMKLKWSKLTQK